jgi:ATP:corrinoid adenosyltransferase
MLKSKEINLLNEKFEGSVEFQKEQFRIMDNEKAANIIKQITEELNKMDDIADNKFLTIIIDELNNIVNMKRLDMKTGWAITKIRKVYQHLIEKEINNLEGCKRSVGK